ncbi:MAG TPA: hypothetical protein VMP01_13315 [Pirellulaceae bacterium]|nr:hypothetical protein [Pirellulaceae bacterium]
MSAATILDTLLDPVITPEVAQRLVALRADPATQKQLDEWGEKANEGTLTPAERQQYEGYVEAIDFIAILQAKARRVLGEPVE